MLYSIYLIWVLFGYAFAGLLDVRDKFRFAVALSAAKGTPEYYASATGCSLTPY